VFCVLCLELFVNAFAFLLKSFPKKRCQSRLVTSTIIYDSDENHVYSDIIVLY
jgi:hypothetical protein